MSSVEKRRSDFSCFKCEKIIPGPYTELSRHFRIQHGFKTAGKERNNLVCGQNGCQLKIASFANFAYHLKICEKNIVTREVIENSVMVSAATPKNPESPGTM